jgi:DNA-binding MarR family transcriptional regulator
MYEIDKIIAQWNRERPELDVAPMALVGRFMRIAHHLSNEMEKTLKTSGLNRASFDVLATLRRSGSPYRLSPNDLLATMMITSGTMTNRIDQLEKLKLVERVQNPQDRRSVYVALTDKGLSIIDAAVTKHVQTQARLVAGLSDQSTTDLNRLLAEFLDGIENN